MQALFFFSKYEGFGLPILEAAHYNKKIITTNISAIPEVAPKNSLLLELEDSDLKCAEHIHHYLKKSVHLNNSEHLKKFTWERAAAEMLKEISS
jgi:glycosyltransferase involved in cell wall biosynthesis